MNFLFKHKGYIKPFSSQNFIRNVPFYNETEMRSYIPITIHDLNKYKNIVIEDVIDHPCFTDKNYVKRKHYIQDISSKFNIGDEIPVIDYSEIENKTWKYVTSQIFPKMKTNCCSEINKNFSMFQNEMNLSLEKIPQIKDISNPAFGSTEFFVFRGKKDVSDSDFIYYLSKTDWFRQNAINSFVGASGRQRADTKFVGKTKLLVPPLKTQRKIAKTLSSYDDLIETNLQRIKLLEELVQYTYEDWFAYRKIDGEIIKDSEIYFVTLEELIQNYMNGGWGKDIEEGGYVTPAYVIRGTDMPDISNGYFDRLPLRFHTKGNFLERRLIDGDIIIEMSNGNIDNVGRSFYINDIFIKHRFECTYFIFWNKTS